MSELSHSSSSRCLSIQNPSPWWWYYPTERCGTDLHNVHTDPGLNSSSSWHFLLLRLIEMLWHRASLVWVAQGILCPFCTFKGAHMPNRRGRQTWTALCHFMLSSRVRSRAFESRPPLSVCLSLHMSVCLFRYLSFSPEHINTSTHSHAHINTPQAAPFAQLKTLRLRIYHICIYDAYVCTVHVTHTYITHTYIPYMWRMQRDGLHHWRFAKGH